MIRDLLFALRVVRRKPLMFGVVIASMALATGAAATAFSLVDAAILRPLPVRDAQKLIYLTYPSWSGPLGSNDAFPYAELASLSQAGRDRVDLFAVAFQEAPTSAAFEGSENPSEEVGVQWISGSAFGILGLRPALGRLLTPDDDRVAGESPVAVLSYEFWSRRFERDPQVIGRWMRLGDQSFQIVGVAQKGFFGTEPGVYTDVWVPIMMWPEKSAFQDPGWNWLQVWGRLKAGSTADEVSRILQPAFARFRKETAARMPATIAKAYVNGKLEARSATHGPSPFSRKYGPALWALAAVAGLVVLLACANTATLLVANGGARQHEFAMRAALGAGRARLVRQSFVESLILGVASSAMACWLAAWAAPIIVPTLAPSTSHVNLDVGVDVRMLVFLAALCLLTTMLSGLAPALRASTVVPGDVLKANSPNQSSRRPIAQILILLEAALCFLVLFVSSQFVFSFARLASVDLGFQPDHLVLADIEGKGLQFNHPGAPALWRQLREGIAKLPGVSSASSSCWGLFTNRMNRYVRVPGTMTEPSTAEILDVSPDFFKTMQIPLLAGRDIEESEGGDVGASAPAVVNKAFVDLYLGGNYPTGEQVDMLSGLNTLTVQESFRIAGIVGNARQDDPREPFKPIVYLPMGSPYIGDSQTLEIRTGLGSEAVIKMLRTVLPQISPVFHLSNVTTQSQLVRDKLVRERLLAFLSAFFAGVAAVLAGIGLYGLLSNSVTARFKEIGIRRSLGAGRGSLASLILGRIAVFTVFGIGLGLIAAVLASGYLSNLLFQQKQIVLGSAAATMVGILITTVFAALPPLIRAFRIDPAVALRYE